MFTLLTFICVSYDIIYWLSVDIIMRSQQGASLYLLSMHAPLSILLALLLVISTHSQLCQASSSSDQLQTGTQTLFNSFSQSDDSTFIVSYNTNFGSSSIQAVACMSFLT